MAAYLFVHFSEESLGGEQIYFSVSLDGLHWKDLNDGNPVLCSDLGEKGVRDPFIVQHPYTGMYHLIATDLNINARNREWHNAIHAGSRNIIIWDSPDLINWSAPRAVPIAPDGAGCAWAPEAVWDAKRDTFMVIFAPYTEEEGEEKGQGRHRIYAAYTKDFVSFTPAFKYMEHEQSVIDLTIVHNEGIYYRFFKDEVKGRIQAERGADLLNEFDVIDCAVLDAMRGLEGPECYRLPDGRWCLICDQYAVGKGYLPIIIEDMKTMQLHLLQPEDYDLGSVLKRHGGVLCITDEEYERLIARFGCN